jgi:phospholipid/cholesterol/gamma-HCH transport system substrate-binding protein
MTRRLPRRPWTMRMLWPAAGAVLAGTLTGCSGSVTDVPLPGGAKVGDHPYTVQAEFHNVLDLVPQSAVKVNDVSVGRVTKVSLTGWHAKVTLLINGDVDLPDNALASIRQTSILGEKFVSLAAPEQGAVGRLTDGDTIPLGQTDESPEIEQVLSALSLVLNGGSVAKLSEITTELNHTFRGRETDMRVLLNRLEEIIGTAADSKRDLVEALGQIDRLARQTRTQTSAIDKALDHLPAALHTIESQRDGLVAMISSLTSLSSVATDVIRKSRSATVHDLRRLGPIVANLAKSGDDLVNALRVLPTFPFPDAVVGNTPQQAASTATGDYLNTVLDFNTDFGRTFAAMTPTERAAMIGWLQSQDGVASTLVGSAVQ